MNAILIVAHAPLAHALRQCALHVFPDCGNAVAAIDVQPDLSPEETLGAVRIALDQLRRGQAETGVLVLTDIFGATPTNVAQKVIDGERTRLVTGANLPMVLRSVSYRHESLESLVARAVTGGTQGVMQVNPPAPPQNQNRRKNDPQGHDDQQ